MNKMIPIICTLLLNGIIACSSHHEKIEAINKTDTCLQNPANSYEVYVPQRESSEKNLPLLVIIDSHGDGKFAIEKFKQAADQYPAILAASDLVKNNFAGYEQAIQELINDVRNKYPAGKTLFITGFSGGARMALGYASTHPVDGIISCGALGSPDVINKLNCPIISISGMDDFNFAETAQYLFQQEATPRNLNIELTNASHAWPDSPMLTASLGFLCFSGTSKDLPKPSEAQMKTFSKMQQSRIDSLKKQGEILKSTLIAHNMSLNPVLDKDKTFTALYNSLKNSQEYQNALNSLGQCLNYEMNNRKGYIDAFTSKDSLWWKNEIENTDKQINTANDLYTKDMYHRVKGFWGIASYSLCKQAIAQHNAEALGKIIIVYRMLEPENSDMFYFSAFLPYWKNDEATTISSLQKARKAGYADMQQLKRDFSEKVSSQIK